MANCMISSHIHIYIGASTIWFRCSYIFLDNTRVFLFAWIASSESIPINMPGRVGTSSLHALASHPHEPNCVMMTFRLPRAAVVDSYMSTLSFSLMLR